MMLGYNISFYWVGKVVYVSGLGCGSNRENKRGE